MPPYLAGREAETREFVKLLTQEPILQNLILTGLRGLGKTVLLETFKPLALDQGWVWVGTDLSESSSVTEASLSTRLLADISVVTSSVPVKLETIRTAGFVPGTQDIVHALDYATLSSIYNETPGLVVDKLKRLLELLWMIVAGVSKRGIIFAYDEAQNLGDHAQRHEYPLSVLLDVFQSIQRRTIPCMLILTGLPTLFPRLVEARTYTERMFHIISLDRLNERDSAEAIIKPIKDSGCPLELSPQSVQHIYSITRGYPYFIQYVCREAFDIWVLQSESGQRLTDIPLDDIMRKLDYDFFAGRWARATDRQRDLLGVIAQLQNSADEFTVQEIVERSKALLDRPFSSSHVNQMLASLGDSGLVYKNRWGKYSLAVPLLDEFIRRQWPYD
jgi:hypothetical protein